MTLIVGHRGASNLWPENSLSGFRNLLALPVEAVEFDVHLTDAGELLVIHDPMLDRTTDRAGPVRALGPGERHDVTLKGSDGEGIPTLEEVLSLFRNSSIELQVDLKADAARMPYARLEAKVAELLDAMGLADRAFLTSFYPEVLATVRRVAPHMRTLLSFYRGSTEGVGLAARLKTALTVADVVDIEMSLLSAEWEAITRIVPLDRLGVWTPNSQEDLAYRLAKGLRNVTTDRPDIALSIRDKEFAHAAD